MSKNDEKQNGTLNQNTGNGAPEGGEQQANGNADNRTWLKKCLDGIETFAVKHPKLTIWTKRVAKAGMAASSIYCAYKMGQRNPIQNVPVVTITAPEAETESEEPVETEEPKDIWNE